MTGQHYRVVADRDKGDNPRYDDAQPSDRLTFTKPRSGLWLTRTLDRIERPVPTTGEHCSGRGECAAPTHVHGSFADRGDCDSPDEHAPQPPTREQIAEMWDQARNDTTIPRDRDGAMLPVDAFEAGVMAAFALPQKGGER